jgi:hemolysin III
MTLPDASAIAVVERRATPLLDADLARRSLRVREPFNACSHLVGLVLALLGAPWLVLRSGSDRATRLGMAVYGVSLVLTYASSFAYHAVIGSDRTTRRLRSCDHFAIYLQVAGTGTPVFVRAFQGGDRVLMLSLIWGYAVGGILLRAFWPGVPRVVSTSIYVVMGWMIAVRWSAIVHAASSVTLALLVAGGVVYTLGAVVYARKRPDPLPGVVGFHGLWHLLVLGGGALHFAALATLR